MQKYFIKLLTLYSASALLLLVNLNVLAQTNKSPFIPQHTISFLLINDQNVHDNGSFVINRNASKGYDAGMDLIKNIEQNDPLAICFPVDSKELSVNAISDVDLNSSTIVPINISTAQSGMLTLKIEGAVDFGYRYSVYLKDKKLNKFINLRANTEYSFYQPVTKNEQRFELLFDKPNGAEETSLKADVSCYSNRITIKGEEKGLCKVKIYSLTGICIGEWQGDLVSGIEMAAPDRSGICLVYMSVGNKSTTKKIYIN